MSRVIREHRNVMAVTFTGAQPLNILISVNKGRYRVAS